MKNRYLTANFLATKSLGPIYFRQNKGRPPEIIAEILLLSAPFIINEIRILSLVDVLFGVVRISLLNFE